MFVQYNSDLPLGVNIRYVRNELARNQSSYNRAEDKVTEPTLPRCFDYERVPYYIYYKSSIQSIKHAEHVENPATHAPLK